MKISRTLTLYRAAQKLYPAPFQSAYAKEQFQTLSDMLDNASTSRERYQILARVWTDLAQSIFIEQINYQGGIVMNDTPKYVKTVSLISAAMLVPFLLALVSNAIDRLVYHSNLYGSWLWQAPYLRLWVLLLPEAALLLAIIAFAVYLVRGNNQPSWVKRLTDLRRTWPVVVPGIIALGILLIVAFHDSFQCVRFIANPGHAVQCAVNNQSIKIFHKFL